MTKSPNYLGSHVLLFRTTLQSDVYAPKQCVRFFAGDLADSRSRMEDERYLSLWTRHCPVVIPLIVGETDATNYIGIDSTLDVHIRAMRQGFGLVSLFTAVFNHVLIAARSFVHAFFECLEACRKGCISLVQCELTVIQLT
jgi:hypothetical protein